MSAREIDLGVEIDSTKLAPEERFLWRLVTHAAASVIRGGRSDKKSDIVEAIENLEWFMDSDRPAPCFVSKFCSFRNVCETLGFELPRIHRAIRLNPDFPTQDALKSRLRDVIKTKRNLTPNKK